MTRSSHNWKTIPGSFDALHTSHIFPTDSNPWNLPLLPHAPITYTPAWLVPYRTRVRSKDGTAGGAVHFFLDDYRFESVWSRPQKSLQALCRYRTLLTPDFSLYADYPLALQLWNTYRSRWCGVYWQHRGFQVIPTISWSTPPSYTFCFAGVPQHSLVAISTVGIQRRDQALFTQGYCELITRLRPSQILCYGKLPSGLENLAEVKYFVPRTENLHHAVTT